MSRFSLIWPALTVTLACILVACGRPNMGAHTSQVAAKVNGDEITVSQLNFVLSQMGIADQQQANEARHKALSSLIDSDLLARQALEQGLDRDPHVLHALQYSRQQVLAKAYIDHVSQQKGMTKPSASQIREYYDKHPDLFSKRRIYRLRHIRIDDTSAINDAVRNELAHTKSFAGLSRWLKDHDVHFTTEDRNSAAEDLPLGLLPKLNNMKDGDVLDISNGGTVQGLQLLSSEEQSLTRKQAAPLIARFLVNTERMEIARTELKRLRDSAKIELVGSFKEPASGHQAGTASVASSPSESDKKGSDFMSKGLSGLK